MLSSGLINVRPLITKKYIFEDSVEAFNVAADARPENIKIQIEIPQ